MSISIAIIGGGAAGMMAACRASQLGADVTVFEKNEKFGRKLGITGKGRCNVTNDCTREELMNSIPRNPRFLYSAFAAFAPEDTKEFFESRGVELKTERGNRVFPVSDKAADIVNALRHAMKCDAIHEKVTAVRSLPENGGWEVETEEDSYRYDRVIVATGGLSYTSTGSDGDGYRFAEALGIEVTPLSPSLCPLETVEHWCMALTGLSLKNVSLTLREAESGKTVYTDFGEMMFTHHGITGPTVLSASAHLPDMANGKYKGEINMKPALDDAQLDARLLRDFAASPNKNYSNILQGLLPSGMIPVFVRLSGIDGTKKVNALTKADRAKIIQTLHCLPFTVKGFRPIEEAIVTRGGISVKELNPKTMECRKHPGLYFAGEVIDVDGYTGGFNLQIAFSTAVLAAENAANEN